MKATRKQHYQTGIAQIDIHYTERIANLSPDIIHVHSPAFAGIEGLRLTEKFNVPLVGTFHSKYYDDFLRVTHSRSMASLGSRYVAEFYSRCDEVWTVSEDAAATLRSYGFKGNIFIMPNGTTLRKPKAHDEKAARAAYGLNDSDERILLYVGQIDFKKNLSMTLEAAALLKNNGRRFKLILTGQGQDREALAAQAETLGIADRVIFTGHVSDTSLLDGLYMAADIFVFPSLYDTAGLVVREAAVMGTPSVVVEHTAPAEVIIDGENGLVCQNTPLSLAAELEKFLYGTDERERDEMSRKARASIPLDWDSVMEQVRTRYEYLISKGHTEAKIFRPFESITENVENKLLRRKK